MSWSVAREKSIRAGSEDKDIERDTISIFSEDHSILGIDISYEGVDMVFQKTRFMRRVPINRIEI